MEEYFFVDKNKLDGFGDWKNKEFGVSDFEESVPGIIGGGFGIFMETKNGTKNAYVRKYKQNQIFDLGNVLSSSEIPNKDKYAVVFSLNKDEKEKCFTFTNQNGNEYTYCLHTSTGIKTVKGEKNWVLLSSDRNNNNVTWL